MLRKKQEVGGKIGHDEYTYYLGDPSVYTQDQRIRGQGDIVRGGPGQVGPGNIYHKGQPESRPPWGIDADDNPRQRRPSGYNNALVPAAGMPSRGNGNGPDSAQSSPYGPPAVPQSAWPAPANGSPQQPTVMAFGPVVASNLPPVQPLTGVLPPIYRPKPPLSFHNAPMNPYLGSPQQPAMMMQPPLYYSPAGQMGSPSMQPLLMPSGPYFSAAPEIEMTPMKQSPRPTSSPAGFLPPVYGGGGGQDPVGPRGRRRSSGGNIPGLGGLGGDDGDDGQQVQADARRRAQQLQDENARLMQDQKRRKEEERQRKIDEDRVEERRLQKEREAVSRREMAEVEREREEKEMKMMGPAAYAAKKRQEEEQRKRSETPPSPPPETAAAKKPAPAEEAKAAENGSIGQAPPAPYLQGPLFSPPAATNSHTSSQSFNLAMQPAPLLSHLAPQQPQRLTTYSYEADHLKAELRQIADEQRRLERLIAESLRANQATAAATLRAVVASTNNTNSSSNVLGAGTYLTDALPLSGNVRRTSTYTTVSSPRPAAVPPGTAVYRQEISVNGNANGGASGSGPSAPSSSSWLDAYLKPNPAVVGGAYPAPASANGLNWGSGPDLTTSTRILQPSAAPGGLNGNANGGISVLASQIHASTTDWSASRNRSTDPEDLSFEPSVFVGPVVPPPHNNSSVDDDNAEYRVLTEAANVGGSPSGLPLPVPTPPVMVDGKAAESTPNTSILKKKGSSPHDNSLPERKSGTPAVCWDEL